VVLSAAGTANAHASVSGALNSVRGPVQGVTNTVTGVTNTATGTVRGTVEGVTNSGPVNNVPDPPGNPVTGPSGGGTSGPSGSPSTGVGGGGGSTPSGPSEGAPTGGGGSPSAGGGTSQSGSGGSTGLVRTTGGGGRKRGSTGGRGGRRGGRGGKKLSRRGGAQSPIVRDHAARKPAGGAAKEKHGNPVSRVIHSIERVIPGPVKVLILLLALLALGFGVRSRIVSARAKRLERQREELLGDVGLLQRALLPEVPDVLRGIDVSVAYRPADGPAAGGDFYDVFELDGGRTAIIVGDVCGHGRAALAVTALMRYTLRAYLGVGLEPRVALEVAARALDGDPDGALTTVVLAVYDPADGTLTYACAGHEAPIVLGPAEFEPVTVFSAPPLGGFMLSGMRQTTVGLPPESSVCFFTDGLVEARLGDDMIGRRRLSQMLAELGPDSGAQLLLERLAASADRAPDDMAACLLRTRPSAPDGRVERVEELVVDDHDLDGERVAGFLCACGLDAEVAVDAMRAARARSAEFGGALLRVVMAEGGARVEVSPRETPALQVPGVEAARRRAALEIPPDFQQA
jgi:serine phosphatase RsbU (regulator of sigma subunit)